MINPLLPEEAASLNVAAVLPVTCHALPTSGTCSGSVRRGSKDGAVILGRVFFPWMSEIMTAALRR